MAESMIAFRKELDFIDKELIDLLERRFEICKRIGAYKKHNGVLVEDLSREQQVIENRIKQSRLSPIFIGDFFNLLFKESKRLQEALF